MSNCFSNRPEAVHIKSFHHGMIRRRTFTEQACNHAFFVDDL